MGSCTPHDRDHDPDLRILEILKHSTGSEVAEARVLGQPGWEMWSVIRKVVVWESEEEKRIVGRALEERIHQHLFLEWIRATPEDSRIVEVMV